VRCSSRHYSKSHSYVHQEFIAYPQHPGRSWSRCTCRSLGFLLFSLYFLKSIYGFEHMVESAANILQDGWRTICASIRKEKDDPVFRLYVSLLLRFLPLSRVQNCTYVRQSSHRLEPMKGGPRLSEEAISQIHQVLAASYDITPCKPSELYRPSCALDRISVEQPNQDL
jgi:hypothetical protein